MDKVTTDARLRLLAERLDECIGPAVGLDEGREMARELLAWRAHARRALEVAGEQASLIATIGPCDDRERAALVQMPTCGARAPYGSLRCGMVRGHRGPTCEAYDASGARVLGWEGGPR